jgi:prepilin-type N-terminal cleavage/methylation domain-containing protein
LWYELNMRRFNNNRGFSLVELSIVLVIIGLLVGLGGSMIGPMMNFVKVRETRDMQDANLQSIISWASSRNTIPTAIEFSAMTKSPKDAWGQDMLYLYDATLNTAPITKDTICGRRSTVLKINTGSGEMNDIALAILSRADNADNNAFKSRFTGTLSADATHVSGAVIKIVSNVTPSGSANGTIDASGTNPDLVRWVTLDELRSKIGCQGAPLKILNNELPYGSASTPGGYSATITADGGVPFAPSPDIYRWCIKTTVLHVAPALLTFKKPDATGAAIAIPSDTDLFQTDCTGFSVTSWPKARQLLLSGTPNSSNSYFFTVYVSDDNSNTTSKPFVLTVNP